MNLRPVKLLSGAPCPLKGVKKEEVNMTFIRENSEGEYAGSGSWLYRGKPQEVVIQDGGFSRAGGAAGEAELNEREQGKRAELFHGVLGSDI